MNAVIWICLYPVCGCVARYFSSLTRKINGWKPTEEWSYAADAIIDVGIWISGAFYFLHH